ncbi:hypothetical protein C8Q75DRAFT_787614 [Abortiporus biennis]|nr:hypothetical protein C8Q75DRAFT_787614 [Abortiporus biennis]
MNLDEHWSMSVTNSEFDVSLGMVSNIKSLPTPMLSSLGLLCFPFSRTSSLLCCCEYIVMASFFKFLL